MHAKLKRSAGVAGLERLIAALALELAEATDEEVLQACADLGMKPEMRGSAAFIGLKGVSVSDWRRMEGFFDLELLQQLQLTHAQRRAALERRPDAKAKRPRRRRSSATAAARPGKDDGAGEK
jgi:hypothetical protein